MAGDAGNGPIRYWLVGIVDFCCVLMAFERYDKGSIPIGTAWLAAGLIFSLIGLNWQTIREKWQLLRANSPMARPDEMTLDDPRIYLDIEPASEAMFPRDAVHLTK